MQCTACHKTIATIHVLDLEEGIVVEEHSLCPSCAESAGYVHPKAAPLKISPEMLEDLIGGMKSSAAAEPRDTSDACPACGLTIAQFRARGRLGCPRCYEMFRKSLIPLLERVHDGTSHRGRSPGKPARMVGTEDKMADLRGLLREAIRSEDYELAARLRDQIQELSQGHAAEGAE